MPGILKVNCLVLGDPEGEIFTIKVAATENISRSEERRVGKECVP